MQLLKVLFRVVGILLVGVIVGNLDRLLPCCSSSEKVCEAPVEPVATVEPAKPVVVAEPVKPVEPVVVPKVPEKKEEEALHLVRVVANEDHIRVAFSDFNYLQNVSKKNFIITPEVKDLEFETNWNGTVDLEGDFKGDTTYTLTVKAGVRSYRLAVKEDITTTFHMKKPLKRAPALQFLSGGSYLPLNEAKLPYEVLNISEVTFTLYRAYENNLVPYGSNRWEARRLMVEVAEETVSFADVPTNVRTAQMVDVAALAKQKPGVYRLVMHGKGGGYEECFLTLTDLGVAYAYDASNTFQVAVQSISTGAPVAGATVEVSGDKNQLLFRGITDATGVAQLTLCPEAPIEIESPMAMIVRTPTDLVYLNLTEHLEMYGSNDAFEQRAMLWTDRGAVRPEESVRLHGMVRDKTLAPLKELPVTLKVVDTRDTEILSSTLTTDAEGIVWADVAIPEMAPSGTYVATLTFDYEDLARTTFYVADFVPDRMRVSVAFEGKEKVVMDARTYFNTDVADAEGQLTVRAIPVRSPEVWEEWVVGKAETTGTTVLSTAIQKTANQKIEQTYTLERASAPLRLTATATLAEPGGRSVTGTASDLRFTEPAYIGLRDAEGAPQMTLLTLEETAQPMPVTAKLVRREWNYLVVRKGGNFRYQWEEQTIDVALPVSTFTLEKGVTTPFPMTQMESGRYCLTVTNGQGLTTELSFWHSAGEAGERSENPSALTFKTNQANYCPGETAQLTFTVPSEGTVLIAGGGTTLAPLRSQPVSAGICTVEIPIPVTTTLSTWTVGITFVAKDVQKKGRLFGIAKLPINLASTYGLKVAIEADAVVRPKATAEVKLKLTTADGLPVGGEVVVMVVDEGVLALTDFKTPNPLAALTIDTRKRFWMGDIYGALFPYLRLHEDGRIGGGLMKNAVRAEAASDRMFAKRAMGIDGGADEEVTIDFADLVRTLLPPQQVPATGELTVALPVPNLQGAMRIMVIAAGDRKVGSGERSMVVRPEATLLVSGVRYACPGDVAELTATATNCDLPEGPYMITLGETSFEGTLAAGASVTQVTRAPVGTTTATLTLHGRECVREEVPVLVRAPIPEVRATTFKLLPAGAAIPEGAVRVGDMAEVAAPSLDWLANYPYQCTEQLAARVLPFVGSSHEGERALVANVCQQLLVRQLADGGFGMWPGARSAWAEGSLVAAYALLTADRLGTFVLSAHAKQQIIAYLETVSSNLAPAYRGTAAYATWVLSTVRHPSAVMTARNLLASKEKDAATFLSAATLIQSGYANEGAPVMVELLTQAETRKPVLPGIMDETAQRAFEIAIAAQCGLYEHLQPTTLARFFTGERQTTQQNAWMAVAVQALGNQLPEGCLVRQTETVSAVRPGQPITLKRTLRNAAGEVITTLPHGELAYLCIEGNSPCWIEHVAVRDLLPGGLEYEDAALATRANDALPQWARENRSHRFQLSYTQKMGHEVRWFGSLHKGDFSIVYPVRATTRGTFAFPATVIEDMYNPIMTGATVGEGVLTVE